MRVVFLGTPQFAVPSLKAVSEKYEVVGVVTQPDREKDRKGRLLPCAVKVAATELGLPVFQYEKIKVDGVQELKSLAPDVMITCAYGQILSQEILDIAPYGVINVHGSLLPAKRGSAPIQRALIDGDKTTGITIMKTDKGMDSGDMLASVEYIINDNDYVSDLYEKLSVMGARLLIDTLDDYISGKITPVKQDESAVTFAPPLKKEEAYIDFTKPNTVIRNALRGYGYAVCSYNGVMLKIFAADLTDGNGTAGEIIDNKKRLVVACGEGALSITELQLSGKKRMTITDFLNGVKMQIGEKLESI